MSNEIRDIGGNVKACAHSYIESGKMSPDKSHMEQVGLVCENLIRWDGYDRLFCPLHVCLLQGPYLYRPISASTRTVCPLSNDKLCHVPA